MKKTLLILMLTLLSAMLLTGCASNADTLASPTPGATNMLDNLLPGTGTATESPMTDNATMQPDGTAAPAATIDDTRKTVQAMEEAVEKLSEVEDAYVITLGDTAIVGLEFENQYQGGTDDRLKSKITFPVSFSTILPPFTAYTGLSGEMTTTFRAEQSSNAPLSITRTFAGI